MEVRQKFTQLASILSVLVNPASTRTTATRGNDTTSVLPNGCALQLYFAIFAILADLTYLADHQLLC